MSGSGGMVAVSGGGASAAVALRDAEHDDDFGSGFNASFDDILRRVEPEVFAESAKKNHHDTLDDILGDDAGA